MAENRITNNLARYKYEFQNFETKQDFVKEGEKAAKDKSRRTTGAEIKTFINQPLLEDAMKAFEELFVSIDMGGAFKKSRLRITDDKRGIFDFGIASKGLYRAQEYYSEQLEKESPFEFPQKPPGVVPFEHLHENILKQFWYTSQITGKKYLMHSQQEGTQGLKLGIPDAKLVFKTTTKKSYVMFERKGGKAKLVDLYIPFSASAALNEKGMLVRIMPLLLAARYMESAGIRTRISLARMYSENSTYLCYTYPIKDYGEDIDFDWMAANAADPRWFRGDLWTYVGSIASKKTNRSYQGAGTPTTSYDEVMEVFNRYKNWYFEDMEKGNQQEIRVHRNLMIAGGIQEPRNDLRGNLDAIKREFFRIVDVVDFQFNKTEKSCERIYRRMVENEKQPVSAFKFYVTRTLADAYSYPTKGEYATEGDERDRLEEELDKQLDAMDIYLQGIL